MDGGTEGYVPTHITLNWKPRLSSLRSIWEVMLSKPTWLWGKTVGWLAEAALIAAAMTGTGREEKRGEVRLKYVKENGGKDDYFPLEAQTVRGAQGARARPDRG